MLEVRRCSRFVTTVGSIEHWAMILFRRSSVCIVEKEKWKALIFNNKDKVLWCWCCWLSNKNKDWTECFLELQKFAYATTTTSWMNAQRQLNLKVINTDKAQQHQHQQRKSYILAALLSYCYTNHHITTFTYNCMRI